jgi:hypothetical protein
MKTLTFARFALVSALLLTAGAVSAFATDRFSVAVGTHERLLVFGPNGDQKADLPLPSISQNVAVGATMFQISYGRDANGLLTAIIAPNPSQPQDLHFNVLGKAIDTNKSAVVTLTFSKSLNGVKIDPGYIGEVEVNSHRLGHDSAANHMHPGMIPRTPTPSPQVTLTAAAETPTDSTSVASASFSAPATPAAPTAPTPPPITTPVPEPTGVGALNQQANVVDPRGAATDHVSDHAPQPMEVNDASQMPFTATATPGPSTVSPAGGPVTPHQHSLYWAEPITPPSGVAPSVGSNEMKLIELKGPVSVTFPGSESRDGQEGMLIPSGSTVATSGGSSVAVFMGGVNSLRLMPDTEVQITQQVDGSIRKTVVALHQGTVFSRVGHHDGETQNYAVQSPEGTAVAKGTEFADSLANGHHYVFVVKGIVEMLINGIQTGLLTPTQSNLASGAMPPAGDGNKVLFAVLTALQPFQTQLQAVIADINKGTASPQELGYFDSLRNTFSVAVDDIYDPTHPNSYIGAFTSGTGFGDSLHSSLERPQDFGYRNPYNGFLPPSIDALQHPFVTPAATPTFTGNGNSGIE